ncbi:unnamed protein product [Amoebophrya sp. A120]|nr:unnamed protein product [Amoebophrya sp. A120]|eukprot:GSA120T00019035001.1
MTVECDLPPDSEVPEYTGLPLFEPADLHRTDFRHKHLRYEKESDPNIRNYDLLSLQPHPDGRCDEAGQSLQKNHNRNNRNAEVKRDRYSVLDETRDRNSADIVGANPYWWYREEPDYGGIVKIPPKNDTSDWHKEYHLLAPTEKINHDPALASASAPRPPELARLRPRTPEAVSSNPTEQLKQRSTSQRLKFTDVTRRLDGAPANSGPNAVAPDARKKQTVDFSADFRNGFHIGDQENQAKTDAEVWFKHKPHATTIDKSRPLRNLDFSQEHSDYSIFHQFKDGESGGPGVVENRLGRPLTVAKSAPLKQQYRRDYKDGGFQDHDGGIALQHTGQEAAAEHRNRRGVQQFDVSAYPVRKAMPTASCRDVREGGFLDHGHLQVGSDEADSAARAGGRVRHQIGDQPARGKRNIDRVFADNEARAVDCIQPRGLPPAFLYYPERNSECSGAVDFDRGFARHQDVLVVNVGRDGKQALQDEYCDKEALSKRCCSRYPSSSFLFAPDEGGAGINTPEEKRTDPEDPEQAAYTRAEFREFYPDETDAQFNTWYQSLPIAVAGASSSPATAGAAAEGEQDDGAWYRPSTADAVLEEGMEGAGPPAAAVGGAGAQQDEKRYDPGDPEEGEYTREQFREFYSDETEEDFEAFWQGLPVKGGAVGAQSGQEAVLAPAVVVKRYDPEDPEQVEYSFEEFKAAYGGDTDEAELRAWFDTLPQHEGALSPEPEVGGDTAVVVTDQSEELLGEQVDQTVGLQTRLTSRTRTAVRSEFRYDGVLGGGVVTKKELRGLYAASTDEAFDTYWLSLEPVDSVLGLESRTVRKRTRGPSAPLFSITKGAPRSDGEEVDAEINSDEQNATAVPDYIKALVVEKDSGSTAATSLEKTKDSAGPGENNGTDTDGHQVAHQLNTAGGGRLGASTPSSLPGRQTYIVLAAERNETPGPGTYANPVKQTKTQPCYTIPVTLHDRGIIDRDRRLAPGPGTYSVERFRSRKIALPAEFDPQRVQTLQQKKMEAWHACPGCGRNFTQSSLPRHLDRCQFLARAADHTDLKSQVDAAIQSVAIHPVRDGQKFDAFHREELKQRQSPSAFSSNISNADRLESRATRGQDLQSFAAGVSRPITTSLRAAAPAVDHLLALRCQFCDRAFRDENTRRLHEKCVCGLRPVHCKYLQRGCREIVPACDLGIHEGQCASRDAGLRRRSAASLRTSTASSAVLASMPKLHVGDTEDTPRSDGAVV